VWTNLLSGAIGAVVGVLGAAGAAIFTINRIRQHETALSRYENTLTVSGDLAYRLVEFYDSLRNATPPQLEDDAVVDACRLAEPAQALRRAITVDGPLLPTDLEAALKGVRKTIRDILPRHAEVATAGDLRALIDKIRPAGDELRKLRGREYDTAPSGMRLTA
jgi:hypothetical protein